MVLRKCEVVSPETPRNAIQEMEKRPFDVLLLCDQFTEAVREKLCGEFRRFCPDGRIVGIAEKGAGFPVCSADLTITNQDPEGMLAAVTGTRGRLLHFPPVHKSLN
jgi:hypothetical protein